MSDFFQDLENQQRIERANIGIGATLGLLAVTVFIRFGLDPSSVINYAPALGGALLGACVEAGIIEHRGH